MQIGFPKSVKVQRGGQDSESAGQRSFEVKMC